MGGQEIGGTVVGRWYMYLLVLLLLLLLVQLNCRLQLLEIKILLVSFTPAINVGDDLVVLEFDTPDIDLLYETQNAKH